MPFFDFMDGLPQYKSRGTQIARMNNRHRFLVQDISNQIRGARVLDLAAHDGRWCYAFAGAGASKVVGIEGRADLISQFVHYPDPTLRKRVTLRHDDIFDGIDKAIAAGETYDVIGLLGIFYHIMDHHLLLKKLLGLKPSLIIIDSEFSLKPGPVIQLVRENTDQVLNAIPQIPGQQVAVKGVPSFKAMEMMAESLGYDLRWHDAKAIPANERNGIRDYYRSNGKMRRAACFLSPQGA